ncbi:MAG: hypothetical protein JWQ68_826, partial [Cryobacterium sp.]|nr:hypothetical protein [Cryobacterium sp.]
GEDVDEDDDAGPSIIAAQFGRTRRLPKPVVLVAAGALLGVLSTLGVQVLRGQPSQSDATGEGAQLLAEFHETNPQVPPGAGVGAKTFRVYEEIPAEDEDVVPYLGPDYEPSSIRLVSTLEPVEAGFGVYVARRGASLYCIIVQDDDHTGTSACATPDLISRQGLRVSAVILPRYPITSGVAPGSLFDLTVTWSPDGTVDSQSVPHGDPSITQGAVPSPSSTLAPYTEDPHPEKPHGAVK